MNVLWQQDENGNISSCVPIGASSGVAAGPLYGIDSGAANEYVVTAAGLSVVMAGSMIVFQAVNGNTGPSTLIVNGLSTIGIRKWGTLQLIAGDILPDQIVVLVNDGVYWQLTNAGSVSGIGSGVMLEVNGRPNANQGVLNLMAGSNILLIDGGNGNITLAASDGVGGSVSLPIPAAEISFDNPSFSSVEAALNHLLYIPLSASLSNNQNTLETGTPVTSVVLNWSFNKSIVSQSVNEGVGPLGPAVRTATVPFPSGLNGNTTFVLTASDGTAAINTSSAVNFYPSVYWGVSLNTTLTNAAILALGSAALAGGRGRTTNYNATGGAYPYYVYPASFGPPSGANVGGLSFSDYSYVTQDVTNAQGFTQSYLVIRFNGIQHGQSISVTWS